MREGLKQFLYSCIKENGELSYSALEEICHEKCYKISCSERRLRELSESGLIRPVRKSGYNSSWVLNTPLEVQTPRYGAFQASKGVSRLDWQSAKALAERRRQQSFLNKL